MTCKYDQLAWRDVLYTDVCRTPGGIIDAARFLTDRRGKAIHPETLRTRLRGVNGEDVGIEMACFLSEWMGEKAQSAPFARRWMLAWNAEQGLNVVELPPEPVGGWLDEPGALNAKALKAASELGEMCSAITGTTADGRVTDAEREMVVAKAWDLIVLCFRIIRNVTRWRQKEIQGNG